MIKNVRLVTYLQGTMSTIFKRQANFDVQQALYEQTVAGYIKLFPLSAD